MLRKFLSRLSPTAEQSQQVCRPVASGLMGEGVATAEAAKPETSSTELSMLFGILLKLQNSAHFIFYSTIYPCLFL